MRKDGLDWVAAGDAGWVDAGEGSAGDAEGDVSGLVGEAGQEWQLRWLQIRLGRRCCGGFARRLAGLRTLRAVRAEWNGIERGYRREATREREAVLELLEDRLRDYDAQVVRVARGDVRDGCGEDAGGARGEADGGAGGVARRSGCRMELSLWWMRDWLRRSWMGWMA